MPLNEASILSAARRIQESENILIATHIRPDGDAIGSMIGLGLGLQVAGHQVQMVAQDGVPVSLRHLPGSEQVQKEFQKPGQRDFDLVIFVDCSEMERAGSFTDSPLSVDINLDHHITNTNFAKINLVDVEAAATAEIIIDLFPRFGLKLSEPVAAALLTGLITDTIGFRTPSVRAKTLCLAAKLIETGVDMPDLYRRALTNRSFEAIKFWGTGLSRIERQESLVWTSLTMEDRRAANYPGRDDADLINVLSSIEGANICLIFVEQPNGNIKVSWRSQPGYDVAEIAKLFGGGGHAAAAGAEISGTLAEVQSLVLEKTLPMIYGGHRVQS